MNTGSFIGRMGANPKFFAANGQKKALMTFSLAVKRPGGQKDAQGNMPTDWFDYTAFGRTAELLNQYAPKGVMVCIERCHAVKESYTDKNGVQQSPVKFIVDQINLDITFATNKNGNTNGGGQQQTNDNNNYNNNNGGYNNNNSNNGNNFGQGRQQNAPAVDNYIPDGDGDLPF